jgi:hypothetical protein
MGIVIMIIGDSVASESLICFGGNMSILSFTVFGLILWINEPAPVDEKDRKLIGLLVFIVGIGIFLIGFGLYPSDESFWGLRSILFLMGIGITLTFSGFLKDHLKGLKVIYRFNQVEKVN